MDSKFIKVPFSFNVYIENGPVQQLGVLFDVQQMPGLPGPNIKIRSVGFCGMDVQRFLSEEQLRRISNRCYASLGLPNEAVDTDGAKRYDVVTPEFHSNFD